MRTGGSLGWLRVSDLTEDGQLYVIRSFVGLVELIARHLWDGVLQLQALLRQTPFI